MEDVLIHYGVLGMHWGIRRTPEELGHKPKRSDYPDTVLEGTLHYKSPTVERMKEKGFRFIATIDPLRLTTLAYNLRALHRQKLYYDYVDYETVIPKDKLKDLKRKPQESENVSMETDMKAVNRTGKKGYVRNCMNCVTALELRQRGYDVVARPSTLGGTEKEYAKWFKGLKAKKCYLEREDKESRSSWVQRNYRALCDNLEKYPEGSRGFVGFGYENTNSGHTISWEVKNGTVTFYDAQAKNIGADKALSFSSQAYTYGRLGNLPATSKITDAVMNRKEK